MTQEIHDYASVAYIAIQSAIVAALAYFGVTSIHRVNDREFTNSLRLQYGLLATACFVSGFFIAIVLIPYAMPNAH